MSNPKTAANGMFLAVAASTLARFAMHRPPAESLHAASSRHSIKNLKSSITNQQPLYLHPAGDELDMSGGRRPNLNPTFIADLEKRLGIPFAAAPAASTSSPDRFRPEDIFHYAYAILHSPTYRERYAEFLKIDFPRLPLTADRDLFFRLAAHGADLVALHLLQSPKLDHFLTDFPEKGTNEVDRVIFKVGGASSSPDPTREQDAPATFAITGRVYINATQYFGGIPADVWTFRVGGYQVCEKWLKDRKGRTLDYADLQHYQKIVVALTETTRLMAAIDQGIETQGGWPGAFGGTSVANGADVNA